MTEVNTDIDVISRIDSAEKYLNLFSAEGLITSYTYEKHASFFESIRTQFKVKGSLSVGQKDWLSSLCVRYNEEQLNEGREWLANYDDQMALNTQRVAQYYLSNPPYFGVLARRVMDGHILSKAEYHKMCLNKYAQKILMEYDKEPRFNKGQMVQFRAISNRAGQHAVVLSSEGRPITKAVKGAREYKLLPVGSTSPIYSMEKNLKRAKKA